MESGRFGGRQSSGCWPGGRENALQRLTFSEAEHFVLPRRGGIPEGSISERRGVDGDGDGNGVDGTFFYLSSSVTVLVYLMLSLLDPVAIVVVGKK